MSSSSFDVGTVIAAAEILARTAVALAVSDSNAAAAAAISNADAEEEGGSTVAAALAAIEVDEELVSTLLECLAGTSGKDSGLEGCAAPWARGSPGQAVPRPQTRSPARRSAIPKH